MRHMLSSILGILLISLVFWAFLTGSFLAYSLVIVVIIACVSADIFLIRKDK